MHRVIKSNCLGCQHRRLSQLNHTCLSLSEHKQLELYFDNILLEVNEMNVLRHWDTAVSVMQDISPDFVYMYKLKIYCHDWREADMKTLAWRAKMYSLTCELIRLKNTV